MESEIFYLISFASSFLQNSNFYLALKATGDADAGGAANAVNAAIAANAANGSRPVIPSHHESPTNILAKFSN